MLADGIYLDFLRHILNTGTRKEDRTGTGTISTFGYQMRFDLSQGFPLLTTKKVHFKSVLHELLWFLSGSTNIKYLQDNGVRIWNEWADENGDLGPVYGAQWRNFGGVDQIGELEKTLQNNPNSRRLIVSAWNAPDVSAMKLPPCHVLFQFYVAEGKLSCQLYQRSADAFLGVPFNIASYALLTHLLAASHNLQVGEFIHTIGDAHIYLNHLQQVETQLSRTPKAAPRLVVETRPSVLLYRYEDVRLEGYAPWPAIPAPVSV